MVRFAFISNYLMTDKWKDFCISLTLKAGQQRSGEKQAVRRNGMYTGRRIKHFATVSPLGGSLIPKVLHRDQSRKEISSKGSAESGRCNWK